MRLALRLAIPAAMAALTFVACAANPTASSSAPATGGTTAKVDAKGFTFSPSTLTIAKGTTVTFTNGDAATHTVTSGTNGTKDGKFDKQIEQGASTTITFDTPGVYQYFCTVHASMKGTITVQ